MTVGPWQGVHQQRWSHLPQTPVMLASAPLGALTVGAFDLAGSRGFAGGDGILGFALVAVFYLTQAAMTVSAPEWSETWWTPVVVSSSTLASPLFSLFLVDARPSLVWFWLVGCVIMLGAYLCPPWRVVAVAAVCLATGVFFVESSGSTTARTGQVTLLGVCVDLVPAVAAATVLGRIRRRERTVLEQTRLDPVTKVYNRRGLEHELLEWAETAPDASVSVMSLHLDGFEDAVVTWGGAASDQVLARVGAGLTRAYHRSHLVARFVDHEFVVVSDIAPELLVPSLLRAVRVASPQRPVSASAGVVSGVPVRLLTTGQLVPALERARHLLTRAEVSVDAVARETFDPDTRRSAPLAAPVVTGTHGMADRVPAGWRDSESRGLGWWLVATALLVSAVPRAPGLPPWVLAAELVGCLVLAAGGVWLAQQPRRTSVLARALIALSVPVTCAAVVGAASSDVRCMVLLLVAYPAFMVAMYLDTALTPPAVLLLPVAVSLAVVAGPQRSEHPWTLAVSAVLFFATAGTMAAHIRRRSGEALDELHALTLTDPTTGVLTREGLAREYLDLVPGGRPGVLLVSVEQRPGESATTFLEQDLMVTAGILHELARGRGIVGRVGNRDLALVLPTADRLALLRRRLDAELGDVAPEMRVLVGVAHADEHSEAALWDALTEADTAVRAQRTGRSGGAHLVPADPPG